MHQPFFLLFGSELRYIWRDQIIVQIYIEADIAMAHILFDDDLFEAEVINASAAIFLVSPCTEQALRAGLEINFAVYHPIGTPTFRSEEHTSELQSLMRISYAVFCLKKKNKN